MALAALKHLIYLSAPKPPRMLRHVKKSDGTSAGGTHFLTRSDVSKLLGVSPNTVTRWAREGRLPCHVTLGGHHRFESQVIEQLRQSLSRSGSGPA